MHKEELNQKLFEAVSDCKPISEIKSLVKQGADVCACDTFGATPLHDAHNAEAAEFLIAHGANIYARDKYGRTPLHCVKYAGAAEVLIMHGANVNARDNYGGTPLHTLFSDNPVAIIIPNMFSENIQLLVKHGADINAQDDNGCTPLNIVLYTAKKFWFEDSSIFKEDSLLKHFYTQRAKNDFLDGIVRILIAHGADINAVDNAGNKASDVIEMLKKSENS